MDNSAIYEENVIFEKLYDKPSFEKDLIEMQSVGFRKYLADNGHSTLELPSDELSIFENLCRVASIRRDFLSCPELKYNVVLSAISGKLGYLNDICENVYSLRLSGAYDRISSFTIIIKQKQENVELYDYTLCKETVRIENGDIFESIIVSNTNNGIQISCKVNEMYNVPMGITLQTELVVNLGVCKINFFIVAVLEKNENYVQKDSVIKEYAVGINDTNSNTLPESMRNSVYSIEYATALDAADEKRAVFFRLTGEKEVKRKLPELLYTDAERNHDGETRYVHAHCFASKYKLFIDAENLEVISATNRYASIVKGKSWRKKMPDKSVITGNYCIKHTYPFRKSGTIFNVRNTDTREEYRISVIYNVLPYGVNVFFKSLYSSLQLFLKRK